MSNGMSKDRVEFTLMDSQKDRQATARAAARAFNMTILTATQMMMANCGGGTRMRCRPSQFARFIVYRVEEGVSVNLVKSLDPKMIAAPDTVCDVSDRPATSGRFPKDC